MSDLEKQIKSNNRRTMLRNAFKNLLDTVSEPFAEFKGCLDEKHAKRELERQYQNECRDIYNKYLKFAEENKDKQGVETSIDEKGITTTVVYTEKGPLIKTESPIRYFSQIDLHKGGCSDVSYQGFFSDDRGVYEFRSINAIRFLGENHVDIDGLGFKNQRYVSPVTDVSGFSINLSSGLAYSEQVDLRARGGYNAGYDKFLPREVVDKEYLKPGYDKIFDTTEEFLMEFAAASKIQIANDEQSIFDEAQEQ